MAESDTAYRYDVFISYSHKDEEWIKNWLVPGLDENGLKVAVDYRDFEIGVPSMINMERKIEQSRHTILVLTPAWVESEYTAFESLLVQTQDPSGLKRRLLPIMRKWCDPPDRIEILTYVDFTRKSRWNEALSRLVAAIRDEPVTPIDVKPRKRWPYVAGSAGLLILVTFLLWAFLIPDSARVVAIFPGYALFSELPARDDVPIINYSLRITHPGGVSLIDTLRQGSVFVGGEEDLERVFEHSESNLYRGLEEHFQPFPESARASIINAYREHSEIHRIPTRLKGGDVVVIEVVRSPDSSVVLSWKGSIGEAGPITSVILEQTNDQ